MISYILTSSHERNKTATEHTALRDKCGKLPFNSSKVLHTFSINTGLHGLNTTDLQCWSLGCPRSLHRDTEEKKKVKKIVCCNAFCLQSESVVRSRMHLPKLLLCSHKRKSPVNNTEQFAQALKLSQVINYLQ